MRLDVKAVTMDADKMGGKIIFLEGMDLRKYEIARALLSINVT